MEQVLLSGNYKLACELYYNGVDIPEWITTTTTSTHEIMKTTTIRTFHVLDYVMFHLSLFSKYQSYFEFKHLAYEYFFNRVDHHTMETMLNPYYHTEAMNIIREMKEEMKSCVNEGFKLPLCLCNIIAEML